MRLVYMDQSHSIQGSSCSGRLVESNNIIVVGFGIAGDLRVLRSSGMEGTRGGVSSPHRIVDLNDLVDG